MQFGLTHEELQSEISRRMDALDEAQEETEQLGPYGDLLRLAAVIAFQRAAELIELNNQEITRQLRRAGVRLES